MIIYVPLETSCGFRFSFTDEDANGVEAFVVARIVFGVIVRVPVIEGDLISNEIDEALDGIVRTTFLSTRRKRRLHHRTCLDAFS